jgi:tetratricopeptide (TPR) repeat protein
MKKVIFTSILIATILAGGVLAYSIWMSVPQTAQGNYESGKQLFEAKKYEEATIRLLNAVAQDETHRDARHLLAMTFVAQQKLNEAVKQLRTLIEHYPDDIGAQLALGNIYLSAGRGNPDLFREAQTLAQSVLKKNPDHVGGLILSGNASAGLRDYQASVDLFERAISLDPDNLSAFVSLGTTQTLQKNYLAAEAAFLRARQVNPKDKSAMLALVGYYEAVKDETKAAAAIKEALAVYPTDRNVYLQAVTFYAQTRRYAEGESLLRDVQSKLTSDPIPSLILAELLVKQGRPEDARKTLLNLKEQFPKNVDVAMKLALNLLADQPERARKEVDQIIKDAPGNPIGHILLGELQFFSGQMEAAQATMEKTPAIDAPYPQPHYFLGNIAVKKALYDQAVFHYSKALAVQSSYVPARVALAEVFLSVGKVTDAKEEIRKALEVRPDFMPARVVKAALDRGDKNYEKAEQELNELAKEMPDSSYIQRQLAQYNESRGRAADAAKNLARAQELQPESPEIFRELVLLHLRSKEVDKALQKINSVPADKKKGYHYELAGLAHSQAGRSAEAETAFKRALELDPSLLSSNVYLFKGYVKDGKVIDGKVNEGIKNLDEILARDPKNASVYTAKGMVFESQGNVAEAKKNYNEALRIDPTAAVPANNLAWILAEEGRELNVAQNLAQTARQQDPENAAIADTLGWIYYKLGNHVLAREQLRFAISKEPANPQYQYHLGLVYKETKQLPEAKAALEKAVASKAEFKERSMAQATLKEIASAR